MARVGCAARDLGRYHVEDPTTLRWRGIVPPIGVPNRVLLPFLLATSRVAVSALQETHKCFRTHDVRRRSLENRASLYSAIKQYEHATDALKRSVKLQAMRRGNADQHEVM